MLQRISVTNYALIDRLELKFGPGMNIITGETGAGKSILMGALAMLLGQRADSTVLTDKTAKCIIEGEFTGTNEAIEAFISKNDLDAGESIILRREITKEGKSRAFINDTPVNLQQMKELGSMLVDIHSQHETLLLNNNAFQMSVVDAFAGHADTLKSYRLKFEEFKHAEAELKRLMEEEKTVAQDRDYLNFQISELETAQLKEDEQESLEEELKTLTHAGEIHAGIAELTGRLEEGEGNIVHELGSALSLATSLGRYNKRMEEIAGRLRSSRIELQDIASELGGLASGIQANPERLEIVSARLDQVYRLQQKHKVNTIKELIEVMNGFQAKLDAVQSLGDDIAKLTSKLEVMKKELVSLAEALTVNRSKAIPAIETKIKKLLKEVAMPEAVLKISLEPLPEGLGRNGADRIAFSFSANKGIPLAEISRVASGGELSRLMLCLKAAISRLIKMPTVVFDEIDTGISGETAYKVGGVMQELADKHQLLVITHLPQIASRGSDHYFVYKEVLGKKTFTRVRKLEKDERTVEIARMLSGDKPTAVAMENARELLGESRR